MDILGSLIVGLSSGALYAVFGVLLTLMAVLTRVINFSQVAVGVFGAYLSLRFIPLDLPGWAIVLIAIVASAAISCLLGWIISTWLGESSTTARSAVTVATLLGLISLSFIVFGTRPQPNPPLLIGPIVSFGTIAVTKVGVLMLVVAIAIAVLAKVVLTWTPLGVRLRAISDRQTAAELAGINVRGLQLLVWGAVGGLSGLVISIVGNTQAGSATSMIVLLIPAAAAALVGAFTNLWLTITGGLLVGGLQGVLTSFPEITLLRDWVPIIVIVLFLLWNQRKEVWDVAR
ncbi:ABC transporter permease subunit [Microbacterium pygmaeum]|uniref:Amino acid/amide ABC transporter membrane protein 1, HAAT family n=1 Tax=Microbacterium pygmaeum TaxID=370764 RepID=A0A1G7X8R8_9MICO|nr:branched-chain amino acid ABC transporter permease [Microbacterium pygmaeum]SDG80523.1 amino acid/amide ABC transporter membrane protein 1, HAAT family [Microbacterium pygmaeum]